MMHYLGNVDQQLERKLASYLRAGQNKDGGWPLYYRGPAEISCSIKVYYALKLAGDSPDLPHMAKARETILRLGGASRANVFTRIALAIFAAASLASRTILPVECMLLPRWFPFHLSKVSYWSRTVMVPLFLLYTFKARARNPKRVSIRELFITDPWLETDYFPYSFNSQSRSIDAGPSGTKALSLDSKMAPPPRYKKGRRLDIGAAQWRRGIRCHISGHGQCLRSAGFARLSH